MEKISDLRVGIVVLRGIIAVAMPPSGFDAQSERRDIEQEHVLDVALEHAALDAPRPRPRLRRDSPLVRLLADERAGRFDDLRHAGHAADKHQLVDLSRSISRRSSSP